MISMFKSGVKKHEQGSKNNPSLFAQRKTHVMKCNEFEVSTSLNLPSVKVYITTVATDFLQYSSCRSVVAPCG